MTDRPPDLDGGAGKAWKILPADNTTPTLTSWLLFRPGAHPMWTNYTVSAVHLRDIDGLPPAMKHFPEATHEIMILALDPRCGEPSKEPGAEHRWLHPPNLVKQLSLPDDEIVVKIVELLVTAFTTGMESPDSDFASRLDRVLESTARHFVSGMHVV